MAKQTDKHDVQTRQVDGGFISHMISRPVLVAAGDEKEKESHTRVAATQPWC